MSKRKAKNAHDKHNDIIPEDEEASSSHTQNTRNVLQETQLNVTQPEKRKRVSQAFNDLTDLNDINNKTHQVANCSLVSCLVYFILFVNILSNREPMTFRRKYLVQE